MPDKQLYYGNEADRKTSTDLLQQSSFFFGQSLTQALTKIPDPAKGAPLRKMAISEFEEYLEKYPKSSFAPKCLQKLGMLNLQGGDVEKAMKLLDIDHLGLDTMDRKILKVIKEYYSNGPVGIDALSATLGEDKQTIEEVYEPFLLQEGLLLRTPRGRILSEKAIKHI